MLNELDREMEVRGLDFVRYADDCIIMDGSKQVAKRVMKSVTRFGLVSMLDYYVERRCFMLS